MSFESQIEDDRHLARERGYRFSVAVQDGRGKPWKDEGRDLEDLRDAFIVADHLSAWKVAIFVNRETGGFVYWSSDAPTVLNSDVLTMPMYQPPDEDGD
jgi:hypothetical protein